jgi:hypothetical protein
VMGFVVVGRLAAVSVRADAQVSVRGFSVRAELAPVIRAETGKTTPVAEPPRA